MIGLIHRFRQWRTARQLAMAQRRAAEAEQRAYLARLQVLTAKAARDFDAANQLTPAEAELLEHAHAARQIR